MIERTVTIIHTFEIPDGPAAVLTVNPQTDSVDIDLLFRSGGGVISLDRSQLELLIDSFYSVAGDNDRVTHAIELLETVRQFLKGRTIPEHEKEKMPSTVQYKHNHLIMEGSRVRNHLVSAAALLIGAGTVAAVVAGHNGAADRQVVQPTPTVSPSPSATPFPTKTPTPSLTPKAMPAATSTVAPVRTPVRTPGR